MDQAAAELGSFAARITRSSWSRHAAPSRRGGRAPLRALWLLGAPAVRWLGAGERGRWPLRERDGEEDRRRGLDRHHEGEELVLEGTGAVRRSGRHRTVVVGVPVIKRVQQRSEDEGAGENQEAQQPRVVSVVPPHRDADTTPNPSLAIPHLTGAMSETRELIITLPGKRRVDAAFGPHVVHTDQPLDNGGDDSAPSPFQLFLASIGTCAGIFVQGFCAKRNLDPSGIRIVERPSYDEQGTLKDVSLSVELPADFPEKYRDALLRVVEQCSVKKAIAAQPTFTVRAVGGSLSTAA